MTAILEKTVGDCYTTYKTSFTGKNDKMLLTVFMRFLIPAFGGSPPKGQRSTPQEIDAAVNFLNSLPISRLESSEEILENVFVQNDIPLHNRRVHRSVFKHFLDWVKTEYSLQVHEEPKEDLPRILQKRHTPKGCARRDWSTANRHGTYRTPPYALDVRNNKGEKLFPHDYLNSQLVRELEDFTSFQLESGCRIGTVKPRIPIIKRYLGWKHRYKNEDLANLSLTSIVEFCQLAPTKEEIKACKDIGTLLVNKEFLKTTASDIAKQNLTEIEDYLRFSRMKFRSQVIYLTTFLAVGRFLYREIIGSDDFPNEDYIPIIRLLSNLQLKLIKKGKGAPPSVPYENKSIPWFQALQVCEKMRREADTLINFTGQPRTEGGITKSLQDFLSVALMMVIPPKRARVYYELEIGRTFVYGLERENGTFVPADKLNPGETPKWYLDLKEDDYKTGATYKDFREEIPNLVYPDGKKFYDYIDRWLNVERNKNQVCQHNFFFRRDFTYGALDVHGWHQRITAIFDRETGIPVAPKEFRKMCVTHWKNERESNIFMSALALSMQHSDKVQGAVYDKQERKTKLAPISDFAERTFSQVYSLDESPQQPTPAVPKPEPKYTRLQFTKSQAKNEVTRLKTMGMKDEMIIAFLWDVTPQKSAAYKKAAAELNQILC